MNDTAINPEEQPCCEMTLNAFQSYQASRFTTMALHIKLRDFLRHLVNSHGVDGATFPSEETIASVLNVSKGTARKAIDAMIAEGILSTKTDKGYFIRKPSCASHTVQILVPDWNSPFISELLDAMLAECKQRGANARILRTLQKNVPLAQIEGKPPETRIILLGFTKNLTIPLCRYFTSNEYDVVNVDTPVTECGNGFVGVDNIDGIQKGMAHLMSLGHRRISLLVNEPVAEPNVFERVKEFKRVIEENKLEQSQIEISPRGTWHGSVAKNALIKIMSRTPPPTALFHVSDPGAVTTLECLANMGLAVPQDVSVLGFGDVRASAYVTPALSTVAQPIEQIAKHTIDLILQVPKPTTKIRLPTSLVVRDSTGPVSA